MRVHQKICAGHKFLDWTLHTKWSYTRHNSRLCDDFVQQRRINAHVRFQIISNSTGVLKLLYIMWTIYFVSRRLLNDSDFGSIFFRLLPVVYSIYIILSHLDSPLCNWWSIGIILHGTGFFKKEFSDTLSLTA